MSTPDQTQDSATVGVSAPARTADRLLAESAALFGERGYDAATTRELAARLGITKASLYHHIENKDDLLYRISTESLKRTSAAVREVWETAPAEVRLRQMIAVHMLGTFEAQALYRVALLELRRLTPDRRREVTVLRDAYAQMFRSAVRQDQADGRIRPELDSGVVTLTLLGILNWPVFWSSHPREAVPGVADFYADMFLHGTAGPTLSTAGDDSAGPFAETTPEPPSTSTDAPARPVRTAANVTTEAVLLFDEVGFHAASTRMLAERLGITKATLYHHIKNKDDLLYRICRTSVDETVAPVIEASESSPAADRLRQMARTHLRCVLGDRVFHRVAVIESRSLSPDRLAEVDQARTDYSRLFLTAIKQDQADGRIDPALDPRLICTALMGMLIWPLFWYDEARNTTPDALADFIVDLLRTGVEPS
ncbi:MAG: TetR family transcriptional regulator [Gordonia sp. (in: high G+C Gram-positive bacteria)]